MIRKKIFTIIACLSFSTILIAQQTVTIDVKADVKPISPYIYGANNPTANATSIRWGGNRTTTYNWENNFSNAGEDYLNSSDKHFINGLSATDQAIPAIPILNAVNQAKSRNQYALVTLQAAGYVSADADGSVDETEIAPSSRWKELSFSKGSAYSLTPDLTDNYVYIDEYVNYLENKLGSVGDGGVDAYAIDNEASIWGGTHPLIRPEVVTFSEFFYKTREIGKLVKDISPNADVYGGVFYGWSDMNSFNRETTSNVNFWYARKAAKGYTWFIDYYLDSLKQIETEFGKRIVDVLDVHWYPEAKGTSSNLRIVDLTGGTVSQANMTTTDMINARLQAPRSLWDTTYSENSYIGLVKLLPSLYKSINQYYPGTKIAFTEFKYDAEYHFSGGLALADVLGIFGREGVYMASKWDPINDDFGGAAYKLYLNYDSQGSKFGATSIQATTDNNVVLSTFASIDEQNNLHIIVVNKSPLNKTTTFDLENGYYSEGRVYGFDQTDKTVRLFTEVDTIINSTFDYTIPSYSALHFVIQALPQAISTISKIVESNPSQIVVQFNDTIVLADATLAKDELIVTNTVGDTLTISNISFGANETQLIIELATPILGADSLCTISFSGTSITNQANTPIANISSELIKNELLSAPLYVSSAIVNTLGKELQITFSKPLNSTLTNNGGIEISVDASTVIIDSAKVDSTGYILLLYPSQRIIKHNTVVIENTDITIDAQDGTIASYFNIQAINNGPNYSPSIDSVVILDNFRIEAFVDKALTPTNFSTVGFQIFNNGTPMNATVSYYNQKLTFTLNEPMFKENTYSLSYTDNNLVTSIYGGYLNKITNTPIINRLKDTPPAITVNNTGVATLECENYAYHKSTSILETCTDVGGGLHVGFIGDNNIFGYNIDVTNADTYTFTLRHAGASQSGTINIVLDGTIVYSGLYVPKSGSWNTWKNTSVAIALPIGQHSIEMLVTGSGFNANWISLEAGNNPSNAEITAAQTSTNGQNIYIIYDRKIETLPLTSEINITKNGTPINIASIGYLNNDSTRLTVTLESTIYPNQTILLSYTTTSGLTTENGILTPTTNFAVQNKSTAINSIADITLQNAIGLYPIPAQANQAIVVLIPNNETYTYTITTIDGKQVQCGLLVNKGEIVLQESGTYLLIIHTNTGNITKKILIK